MAYVIGQACIDVTDRSCIEECPVDCIYEGARKLDINPLECIDCGACEPLCPAEAIGHNGSLPEDPAGFAADDARFFQQPLPDRSDAIGAPGGAAGVGRIGVDTELVAAYDARC